MQRKRLIQLVGILAVLLVLAWLSGFFEGAPSTVETPQLSINADELQTIEIRKGDEHVMLNHAEGGWRLTDPIDADVDTTTRSSFLGALGDLKIESLITARAEGHDRYQVDSAQATYIRFAPQTGKPVELYVGKSGPDFQSKYIRLGNDDRVFLASGVPAAQAGVDRWRNKILWSYPEASISEVEVSTDEASYKLVSDGDGWTIDENGSSSQADSAKVARYLTRISSVRADGFLLDVMPGTVADSASHEVDITRMDGSITSLRMWPRASDVAALASGTDDVVKLNTYRINSYAPSSSNLKPD
jgi:hypothetical protein